MANNVQLKDKIECGTQGKAELEKALEQNDKEWQKRMLLLVMIMIIALLGLD